MKINEDKDIIDIKLLCLQMKRITIRQRVKKQEHKLQNLYEIVEIVEESLNGNCKCPVIDNTYTWRLMGCIFFNWIKYPPGGSKGFTYKVRLHKLGFLNLKYTIIRNEKRMSTLEKKMNMIDEKIKVMRGFN